MEKRYIEEEGLWISKDLIEEAIPDFDVAVQVLDKALVIRKNHMTALDVIQTIEGLEVVVEELYEVLLREFYEERKADDREKEDAGEGKHSFDSTTHKQNISAVSKSMRERLRNLGIGIHLLNESIMEEEIVVMPYEELLSVI